MSTLAMLVVGALLGLALDVVLGRSVTLTVLLVVICVALIGMWMSHD